MSMWIGDGLTYDPTEHELLPDREFMTGLKSKLGDKANDLFSYRHRIHETFVLALWWQRPETGRGVMTEFIATPQPFEHMSRDKLPTELQIAEWINPAKNRLREIQREMAAEERDAENKLEDERLERIAAYNRMQKILPATISDHPDIEGIKTGETEWFLQD